MMDRDGTLDGRCSFPAAESTKLIHSNGNSFRWGSSPISSRHRSSSSTNLISLDSCIEDSLIERSRCKNASKIDPRIVADVQSKGLASRIVKYHENGNRLNRSMSAHNLYSKPGHFPIVTLKKTDLPFRASKQNVSMTRIAPPEKSMFYGNTLSSLLRSNSVVGIQKSDEDISRENRPILHPPPTDNDMAPTRSVLDVLKEISRKRINSDDPNTVDTSKKNRIGSDLLDAGANASISNIPPANVTMMAHSFKRQRDVISHYKGEMGSPFKRQDTNKSPEQAVKRVCGYNNDITSSLSSSSKRKPFESKRPSYQLNQTMPVYLESYEAQKVKMQKCHENNIPTDKRFDNLANTIKYTDTDESTSTTPVIAQSHNQIAYGVVPQRSKSEPLQKHEVAGSTHPPINKPRLTLFNKNYDLNNETSNNDIGNEDNLDESSECVGIHFVKPKKVSLTGLKNSVIERTQKSKLALMLSGLKGELYQGNHYDDVDSPEERVTAKKNVSNEIMGHEGNKCVASSNTSAGNNNSTLHTGLNLNKHPDKTSSTQLTLKPVSKNTSPLVGLKLTPQAAMPNPNSVQNTDSSQQLIITPMLGGFSCNNISSITTPVSSTTNSPTSTNSPVTAKVTSAVSFGTLTETPASNPVTTSNEIPAFNFMSNVIEANTRKNTAIATSTTTNTTQRNSFTLSTSNITKAKGANNNSVGASTAHTVVANGKLNDSNKLMSSATSVDSTAFSNTFNFGTNPLMEIKSSTTSAPTTTFSFGVSSNIQTIASSNNFVSTTSASNTQFSFGSSGATNKVQSPLTSAFSFNSSSNKDNVPTFNTSTTNVTPSASSASGLGVAPFNLPSMTTTSNIFGSSNLTESPEFGTCSTKTTSKFGSDTSNTLPSVFGGSSVTNKALSFTTKSADKASVENNSTITPEGFSFGTQSTKSPANGFTFGTTGRSNISDSSIPTSLKQQSTTFTFSSGTSGCDKKKSANIFGGSTAPPETTAPSTGFSFGASTGTGDIQKSAFSFGSSNILSTSGHPHGSPTTGGFSFAATTPAKPKNTISNKAFSFGTEPSNIPQTLGAPNNNQTSSNMFDAPSAPSGSTATFNFSSPPVTNTQPTAVQNITNNMFALPASMATGSGERPIRRATRRLQK